MNEKNQIARRARVIFRVLSGLTLAEGGLVFLLAVYYIMTVPISLQALEYLAGQPYPHSRLLLCLIASANLLFGGMLLARRTTLSGRTQSNLSQNGVLSE